MSYHFGQMPGYSDQLAILQRNNEAQQNNQYKLQQMLASMPRNQMAQQQEPQENFMSKLGTGLGEGISSGLSKLVNDYLEGQAEHRAFGRQGKLLQMMENNPNATAQDWINAGERSGARRSDLEAAYGLTQQDIAREVAAREAALNRELKLAQIEENKSKSAKNRAYIEPPKPSFIPGNENQPPQMNGSGNINQTNQVKPSYQTQEPETMSEMEQDRALKKGKIKKQQQELEIANQHHPKVQEKYVNELEKEREADVTLSNVSDVERYLDEGGQMPEAISRISAIFGKDSAITKALVGAFENPTSQAINGLRAQMMKGAKDITGGRVAVQEFNVILDKLFSTTDFETANKLKLEGMKVLATLKKAQASAYKEAVKNSPRNADQIDVDELADKIYKTSQNNIFRVKNQQLDMILDPEAFRDRSLIVKPDPKTGKWEVATMPSAGLSDPRLAESGWMPYSSFGGE